MKCRECGKNFVYEGYVVVWVNEPSPSHHCICLEKKVERQ